MKRFLPGASIAEINKNKKGDPFAGAAFFVFRFSGSLNANKIR